MKLFYSLLRAPCPLPCAPMVKWKSCLGSNEAVRIRLLVEVLNVTVIYGVCGVAVSARLAVAQKVSVRLRSDTPQRENPKSEFRNK